jgi:hypothetical protein
MKGPIRNTKPAVRSHLLHSFTSHCKVCNLAQPNQHVLTFLHPILLCTHNHVLSTPGHALKIWKHFEYKFWGCLECSQHEGPRKVWLISVHMCGTYIVHFCIQNMSSENHFLEGTPDLLLHLIISARLQFKVVGNISGYYVR